MKLLSILGVLSAATALVAGRADAGGLKELKALGLKAYWSVLDADQKAGAKKIAERFLLETAADRLSVKARVTKYRADVTALLTLEQRRDAGRILGFVKKLDREKRKALFAKVLERTDRAALAERVEKISGASPPDQVELAFAVHDQLFAAYLEVFNTRLALTADQQAQIRALHEAMKTDLRPVALRLAEAKASAVRDALALLRPDQREKLETFRRGLMGKVLEFLRG